GQGGRRLEGGQREQQQDPDLSRRRPAVDPQGTGRQQRTAHREDHRQRHGGGGDRGRHRRAVDGGVVLRLPLLQPGERVLEPALHDRGGGVLADRERLRAGRGGRGEQRLLGDPGGAVGGQRREGAREDQSG